MEKKFVLVKTRAKDDGVSAEVIVKVIKLIEYAEDNDVELYHSEGKLRMRYTGSTGSDKSGGTDFLDDLKNLFGMGK
jgi:hypothetical protein